MSEVEKKIPEQQQTITTIYYIPKQDYKVILQVMIIMNKIEGYWLPEFFLNVLFNLIFYDLSQSYDDSKRLW